MTDKAERIMGLADAHREPVMLMFDYKRHIWTVRIGLSGRTGIFTGLTAHEALHKAEKAFD